MAATAGSVAVGSTIGHGLSSMLFGGSSSSAPVEQAQPAQNSYQAPRAGDSCNVQAKGNVSRALFFKLAYERINLAEFTDCLEKADLHSCTWYLEQLKACQAAAAPY
jgi:hypothetical protein